MIIYLFLLVIAIHFNLESAVPAAPAAAAKPAKKHKLSSLAKQDLFDAVRMRDCVRARAAFASGVPANAQDQDGNTALHMAVAPCDAKQKKESEEALRKRIQCIQLLMRDHGADCTLKNKKGVSVLDALSIPFAAQRVGWSNARYWRVLIPEEERLMDAMPIVMANLRYVKNPAHDWYEQLKKIMVKAVTLYTRREDPKYISVQDPKYISVVEDIMNEGILMPDYPTREQEEVLNKQYHPVGERYFQEMYSSEFDNQEMLIAHIELAEQKHRDKVRASFERVVVQQDNTKWLPGDLIGLIEEHLYTYPQKDLRPHMLYLAFEESESVQKAAKVELFDVRIIEKILHYLCGDYPKTIVPRHIIDLLSVQKPTSWDYDKQAWKKQKKDITEKLMRFTELRPHYVISSCAVKTVQKNTEQIGEEEQTVIDLAVKQDNDVLCEALSCVDVGVYEKALRMQAHDVCALVREELNGNLLSNIHHYDIDDPFVKKSISLLMRPDIRKDIPDWPAANYLDLALKPDQYSHDGRALRFECVALLVKSGVNINFEDHIQLLNEEILTSQGKNPGQERAKLLLTYLENPESVKTQLTVEDKKEFEAIAQEREANRKLDKEYREKQEKEKAHQQTQCAAK